MNKTTKRREKGEIEIVKKTWILLGKIFGLVLLLDLVIELLSRKSLMGLFYYGIGNFPVFLANVLLLLPPFLLILFTRRKVFTAGILDYRTRNGTHQWSASRLSDDTVYGI